MQDLGQFLKKHYNEMIVFMLCAIFFVGFFTVTRAIADELQQKRDQLDSLNEQIAEQRKKIEETQAQADGITAEITAIAKEIEASEVELTALSQHISQTETEIQNKEAKLIELQEEIEKDQAILGERLCVIYEEGESNYLDVLLQSVSLQDFITRVDYLRIILDNDQALIQKTNQLREDVEVEKTSLEIQKSDLEQQKVEETEKKQALEQRKAEQQAILDEVYAEQANYERAEQELENESAMLENLIRSLESGSSAGSIVQGTGVFLWPSNNSRTITSDYGWRYHPILKYNKLHTGMDIGASYGTDILAADSGTVIFAGWNNAYGKMVIISHGGNLSTLYAHQSTLLVSEGQNVERGQVIGKVGSTGWSTGPHLHFEVRVNGSPVNPHDYVG